MSCSESVPITHDTIFIIIIFSEGQVGMNSGKLTLDTNDDLSHVSFQILAVTLLKSRVFHAPRIPVSVKLTCIWIESWCPGKFSSFES
jgi:hypothetical protein